MLVVIKQTNVRDENLHFLECFTHMGVVIEAGATHVVHTDVTVDTMRLILAHVEETYSDMSPEKLIKVEKAVADRHLHHHHHHHPQK